MAASSRGRRGSLGEVLNVADGVYRVGQAKANRRQDNIRTVATCLVNHVTYIVDHIDVVAGAPKRGVG